MPHIKGLIEFDCDFDALAEDLEKNGYVKVVRCNDCRFFKGDGLECHWGLYAYEDDFCSRGERRENDGSD